MINLDKISYNPLTTGEHDVVLHDFRFVPNETTPENSYVRLDLEILDQPGRIINDNRFEKGLDIAISQLRKQLSLEEAPYAVILNLLTSKRIRFKAWVSDYTNPKTNQTQKNFNFLPPLPAADPNVATPVPTTEHPVIGVDASEDF